ncbi:MAG: hypothetical protein ABIF87_11830 [Pseudomonadota bacterium]
MVWKFDIRNIRLPNPIRPMKAPLPQKIRINLMIRMRRQPLLEGVFAI